jgi:hypothetical protein
MGFTEGRSSDASFNRQLARPVAQSIQSLGLKKDVKNLEFDLRQRNSSRLSIGS